MENTFNIILRMMKNDGPVIGATLGAIFLLLVVMIILRRRRKRDGETDDMLISDPIEVNTSMDDLVADARVSVSMDDPVPMPDLDTPASADKDADLTLEMTHELDGRDTVGHLDPEHAFSIEIKDTEPDPSLIAPNFAAETAAPDLDVATGAPDTTGDAADPLGDDDISIPRQGADPKPGRFGLFGTSWRSRKQADAVQSPEPTASATDDAAVTPDAIADAVADLVGDSQAALAAATAATTDTAQSAKAAAALDMAREMNEAGAIDEIERLAEVERKMRALRELFQAGLIAPEVYLLKAREYASESL